MNRRLVTILLIAFVIAGICAWMVYRIVGIRLTAAKPVATTQVVAAAKDIPLGEVLTAADLTTMSVVGTPPKDAILKPEDAIGRGAVSEIYQGEPVLASRISGPGAGGGLAPTIPQGMRACAVRVDEVVGVSGFVTPGMRVDVMASGNPPGGSSSAGPETETILQNIQVLSAGTDIQKDAAGKPVQVQVVNLLVTPEQAEMLSLAATNLRLQLVLRNPLDTQIAKVPARALNSLFSSQAPSATPARLVARRPRKPPVNTYTMIISNGPKTTETKFASPGGQQ
jgi:pilus assembly protein CpaB